MDELTSKRDEINFKREQLRLDRERLELEKEKLKMEREMRRWTVLSILIPLIIVAFTVIASNLNQARQAKIDFALKAAEIIINSDGPSEVPNRMRALMALFPDQFPPDFPQIVEAFDPSLFSSGEPSYDNKMNFIRLMGDYYENRDEMLTMYKQLFPGSNIVEAIESSGE